MAITRITDVKAVPAAAIGWGAWTSWKPADTEKALWNLRFFRQESGYGFHAEKILRQLRQVDRRLRESPEPVEPVRALAWIRNGLIAYILVGKFVGDYRPATIAELTQAAEGRPRTGADFEVAKRSVTVAYGIDNRVRPKGSDAAVVSVQEEYSNARRKQTWGLVKETLLIPDCVDMIEVIGVTDDPELFGSVRNYVRQQIEWIKVTVA